LSSVGVLRAHDFCFAALQNGIIALGMCGPGDLSPADQAVLVISARFR
jgi:hypothetical protein